MARIAGKEIARRKKAIAVELRAENDRLRTALERIEQYRAAAKSGSNVLDDCPWYALGRIAAAASFALRGHGEGPPAESDRSEGSVTTEGERDGTDR